MLVWADMMKQASVLNRRPHVLVCTPGRLVDHIRSTSVLDLSRVRVLVRICLALGKALPVLFVREQ